MSGGFHKLRRQIGWTDCSSKHDIYDDRRRDHFSKYDVVKIRRICTFFEEVNNYLSVLRQEFFESQMKSVLFFMLREGTVIQNTT